MKSDTENTNDQNSQNQASEKHGFFDTLREHTPNIIKDNAPRIVAGMKIIGTASMVLSKNKLFSIAGLGFISADSVTAFFGRKKTEKEKETLRDEQDEQHVPQGFLGKAVYKLTHPRQYPLEAGSTIATLASGFWTASGLFGKGGFSPGRLAGGVLSLAADANIAFTGEHIGEPEANPYDKGSISYYATELKNRPVLLSSLCNMGSDIASIAGGGYEKLRGKEGNTLFVGAALFCANAFQAIFVNKNDYNIEKTGSEKAKDAEHSAIENPAPMLESRSATLDSKKSWEARIYEPAMAGNVQQMC